MFPPIYIQHNKYPCRCWALRSQTIRQRYTLQIQQARWFGHALPPAMNMRGKSANHHTGLNAFLERLIYGRSTALLRSAYDYADGTYEVPWVLGWCGLPQFQRFCLKFIFQMDNIRLYVLYFPCRWRCCGPVNVAFRLMIVLVVLTKPCPSMKWMIAEWCSFPLCHSR